jgi:DNA-binding CsgD family transcriptional regulator
VEDGDRRLFFHLMLPRREGGASAGAQSPLTPRQQQVLARLADGMPAKVIAARLGLAEATVRNHVRGVLGALGVHSQLEAVAKARRLGEVAAKMTAAGTFTALVVDFWRIIGTMGARDLVWAAAERVDPSDARVREWMTEAPAPLPGLSFWRDTAVCELAWETGALEPCPQDACTFWWEDECVLAGLAEGIAEEPERARLFLALREKLAAAEAEGSLSALPGF